MWHFRCKDCASKEPDRCRECETGRFLADCRAAIDLIAWYEHDYHRANLDHEDLIRRLQSMVVEIQKTGSVANVHRQRFQDIAQRVDGWLYQVI